MIKFTSIKEVNQKKLIDYVREAVKLNKTVVKRSDAKELAVPVELSKWFSKNKKAKIFFDSIAYTFRKEMVHHITNAKQEETRKRRFVKVTAALKMGKKIF